jgi:hypothetical protein
MKDRNEAYRNWAKIVEKKIIQKEFQYIPTQVGAYACAEYLLNNLTDEQLTDILSYITTTSGIQP